MGIYRFFLAFCVLLYHSGASPAKFNLGVAAVISFYILAGFVLTNLIDKKFDGKMWLFYLERILRIYPLYLFLALLTLIFVFLSGYGNPVFSFGKVANNLLIIPLNYYMVFDNSIMQSPKWWLIPPAWTLGLELQAYLALSLIIKFKFFKIIASVISLSVFFIATAGFINSDIWGYRLLPGTLFIFMIGSSLYRIINSRSDIFDRIFVPVTYFLCFLLFVILWIRGGLQYHTHLKL